MSRRTYAYLGIAISVALTRFIAIIVAAMPISLSNDNGILSMFYVILILGIPAFALWWIIEDTTKANRHIGLFMMILFFLMWPLGAAIAIYRNRTPLKATLTLIGFSAGLFIAYISGAIMGMLVVSPP